VATRLSPTLELLNSSTIVAISGGFRLHIAFLLAGIAANVPVYCAFSLLVYATYTLDRSLDCNEDAINRTELCGADRRFGLIACISAFLIGMSACFCEGIYLAPFFPFIVGYFYSHGVRIGSFHLKLKNGTGIKNLVTGLTWGGAIALIVSRWCGLLVTVYIIFLFFGLKTFVTSCINDFKDVEGDTAAGIRTLPACLGEGTTKKLLIGILLVLHGIMIYSLYEDLIRNEWSVLLIGLIIMVSFILVYSPAFEKSTSLFFRKLREIAISWESPISLASRFVISLIEVGYPV
jgi:4-hydroxybenzoate polyprenyltransferase